MSEDKNLISIRDLHLYYGKVEALKGVTMDFRKNEITAVIGPSGCGKSTLLKTINRLNDLVPDVTVTGTVKLNGKDIYAPSMNAVDLRKEVGMLFQQPNPFPFSIYDNVTYGLRISGEKDKAVLDEAVERSLQQAAIWDELKDRLHDNALSVSGGQQQRICIARVLATQPKVILMDEPTSALDPISSDKIERTMLKLKEDYTIVIVTRNMQQASRLSDRTAFFLGGKLIEYGKTKDIFMQPEHKETEDYISGRFG
ncbi:MAG TPA: phosphate ABC transporter ATP-binding protein PstB [Lapidilactobacillus dextrinicus]|uniref:Phosphate ABC transporter ATP-binding protein n=2 Tax=Lapidilactobacillus dextrinicus TaxID=51664 RepID=A0A0R2BKQ1_9LACO|nr:phosphate ABC transporter ATP-binding protein PstB [Lapidilactobacillus dextrinicus]KRM79953.1 phosphate ABC transporter ATP-binding protein [Lapidilactobacillus dextrinicus DSM 20335]QFG46270.1 phosphate ABC transporter ATP-binding protein [Lapidilactobacillus dextrinicus]HJE15793.1 phosphate ABC transporter ATP-binding protein PstB [Lapidilactobacillus dextrinicus]